MIYFRKKNGEPIPLVDSQVKAEHLLGSEATAQMLSFDLQMDKVQYNTSCN